MKRFVMALSAAALLGLASAAQAAEVFIDYSGTRVASYGLTQVNSARDADGFARIVRRHGINVAQTGGTDASRYLYLKIAPGFKPNLKSVWLTVFYFDDGLGGFKAQYDGTSSPTTAVHGPAARVKFDTGELLSMTWHLTGFNLKGGQSGGADLRIDDRAGTAADGPEYIAAVVVSDTDPHFSFIPYATTKPTINGTIAAGEWDGAFTVALDHPSQDGYGSNTRSFPFTVPNDFFGAYSFQYDETNLYILGQVHDITPRLNSTSDGISFYSGDAIELFMGMDETNPERTAFGPKDYQIGVGLGTGDGLGWSLLSGGAKSLGAIGNKIAVTNTPDGYVFELQIPWTTIDPSLTVQPGQRIAWYLFADDGQETTGATSQDLALGPTGATGPSGDPSVWLRGVLDLKP